MTTTKICRFCGREPWFGIHADKWCNDPQIEINLEIMHRETEIAEDCFASDAYERWFTVGYDKAAARSFYFQGIKSAAI